MLEKLQSALDHEIATYVTRNPRSHAMFKRAKRSLRAATRAAVRTWNPSLSTPTAARGSI